MDEAAILAHQGGIGVLVVYFIQFLKSQAWCPLVTQKTDSLNRLLGIVFALSTAMGAKYAFSCVAGECDFTIHIPSVGAAGDTLLHAAAQYGGQLVFYHTSVKAT